MKERIKRFAPRITKRKRLDREAVLISINEDIYLKQWRHSLLDGENEKYDTKRIINAYKGMPVFFHYYREGIRWQGEVIDANEGFPIIGNVKNTKRLIDIEEMRKNKIITNNPPRQTQYLNQRRLQTLNNILKQ